MDLAELPERTQDYLKEMFNYEEKTGVDSPVSLGDLATAMGQKLPTTTEAIKRLAAQGLVNYERYKGATLTTAGREMAVQMARKHRLIEAFLVNSLGYSWDEVHSEADKLEHACSELFIQRIDALLGHPSRDPHGDPIPRSDGSVDRLSRLVLANAQPGEKIVMEQVNDSDPELLRYLAEHEVLPGTNLIVKSPARAGLIEVEVEGGRVITLAELAAREISVVPQSPISG